MRESPSLLSFVPAPLQSLMALFARELREVKFADVDCSVLEQAAGKVRDAGAEVEQAEAALDAARARLQAEQDALTGIGHRALAYARIWADSRPELLAELESLNLPRLSRRGSARAEVATNSELENSGAAPPVARKRRARSSDGTETLFAAPTEEAHQA